jgi:hypothetical protein
MKHILTAVLALSLLNGVAVMMAGVSIEGTKISRIKR